MKKEGKPVVYSGGVDISASGDVYIGGDVVGRDKITVFDATVIQWLALGTNRLLGWLRLATVAVVCGLLVAVLGRQFFGLPSITDSAAASILHAAIGAVVGGLVAWYSPGLPAALLRVGWIEGGLVAAEWIFSRLMPFGERSMPAWLGLPILHASLLVSLVGGPWLALATFALIKLVRPGKSRTINRWWADVVAIIGGCLASGLLIVMVFGNYLNSVAPPVDLSRSPQMVLSGIPRWSSGMIPADCRLEEGYTFYLCPERARYDTHREGFIVLPGWLSLSQAVAILISLAMIIPVSVTLYAQTQSGSPRLRRPAFAMLVGFAVSIAIGIGLDSAAASMYRPSPVVSEAISVYERWLAGPLAVALLWGAFGLVSGFVGSVIQSSIRWVGSKAV